MIYRVTRIYIMITTLREYPDKGFGPEYAVADVVHRSKSLETNKEKACTN